MNWTFYLDALEIEEPRGFSDLTIRAKRDENWHGVFFEASTSDLEFYGVAAAYLMEQKRTLGFSAEVEFRAVTDCGGEDEIFTGRLDFRKYKETCGDSCIVTMPVEQEGCIMTLKNRYDQKVDLSNRVAFDGMTLLPEYNALNFTMELAAQETKEGLEGYVVDEGFDIEYEDSLINNDIAFRPQYGRKVFASLQTTSLDDATNLVGADPGTILTPEAITPVLLFEDVIACFTGNFNYDFRLKGSYEMTAALSGVSSAVVKLIKGVWPDTQTVIDSVTLAGLDADSFDAAFSGVLTLSEGDGLYMLLELHVTGVGQQDYLVHFDPETHAILTANKVCPPTDAVVSMPLETASRITEAITDHCLTVKSDYYGRTDSEPYAAAEDGCGSMRVVTSGLRIRNAENPKHFMSLKDFFDGFNSIDNIGMGIEVGVGYQSDVLRIEPVEHFYQDVIILNHDFIPKADFDAQADMAYSVIKVGYKKWESEEVLGLDEFNSNKEFRTSLKSINNTLDITSPFIAGGYPIEITRRQSFADTGQADTKYDNETFVIQTKRMPYAYGNDYAVEQGNISSPSNIYSPETAYNWRIRPMYNLMRWWKSISQSYANLTNTVSKLFFSAGTGNLLASGRLVTYDECAVDATIRAENDDLRRQDISVGDTPIWKPETMTYRYPMSIKDFNLVKANPNGYINAQCGSGDYVKGFINLLMYRPARGEAEITLKLKWD